MFTISAPHSATSRIDMADIGRRLAQNLDAADAAIEDGRTNDAHDALIRAQDIAFDAHLTLVDAWNEPRRFQSTDVHLRLTNRLIDANRTKDRTIIAECRSLVAMLNSGHEPVRVSDRPGTDLTHSGV